METPPVARITTWKDRSGQGGISPVLPGGTFTVHGRALIPKRRKEKSGMRRGVHLAIGLLAFCTYAYLGHFLQDIPQGTLAFGFLAAFAGSILPDLLEPPTSSRHRGFFHSKTVLKVTGIVFCGTALLWTLPEASQKTVLFALSTLALGYLLHLAADAITPRGLPK